MEELKGGLGAENGGGGGGGEDFCVDELLDLSNGYSETEEEVEKLEMEKGKIGVDLGGKREAAAVEAAVQEKEEFEELNFQVKLCFDSVVKLEKIDELTDGYGGFCSRRRV